MSYEALRSALVPLSWLYGAGMATRNRYYDDRSHVRALDTPVISVGNVTVGGSGKTPVVGAVAKLLLAKGIPVAVVSRGYGRSTGSGFVLVSDGRRVLADAREGGDEPVELAEQIPGLVVAVGADRHRTGQRVLDTLGPHVILLDDGFQHRRLHRDLDIVCHDASVPASSQRLLPAGRLREPLASVERADALVITGGEWGGVKLPTFRAVQRVAGLTRLDGETRDALAPEAMHGSAVAIATGVARPERVPAILDANVVLVDARRDHYAWSPSDVMAVIDRARAAGATALLTTGKDAVKWKPFLTEEAALPIYAIRLSTEIHEPAEFEQLVLRVGRGVSLAV